MRTRSRRMAFCGILVSLAAVLLILSTPSAVLCSPILAMVVLLPVRLVKYLR